MKMKKLLAAAMAATMILSSMVTSFVASAATVGKITAGDVTVCPGKENTVSVGVEINFDGEGVKAPHNIVSVAIAGYDLKEVTDIATVKTGEGDVIIDEDGSNLAAGKILFEAPVDSKAPTVTKITFTAVFEANGEEKGTEIVVNGDDMTDVNEAEIGIDAEAGVLTIAHAYEASVTAPTCTAQGFTTHTCACGETYIDTYVDPIAHNYVDGKCTVCGADDPNYEPPVVGPVVDSKLVFYRTSLAYGDSSLELNFRIANTVLDLYSDVEVVILPQKYDLDTFNLQAEVSPIVIAKKDLAAAGSKYKQYTYADIDLSELGLNIDYMLKAYDVEGNLVAISETFTMSAAGYLKTMAADTSNEDGFRTLMVDTLVVCDEVVKTLAATYEGSDLASAVSVLVGVDTSLATDTIGECNTVDNFVSYDSNYGTTNGLTHQIRSSVAIGKVPYINFRVRDAKNALDLNKLEVNVKYTAKDSAGEHPYDKTFSGSDLVDGTFINCTFAEIGIADSDKDILFTVTYDGVKKCEWTYSIETYLSGKTSDPTIGAQSIALIKLGQAFRTYQGL